MDKSGIRMAACIALSAAALTACTIDKRYYIKTDGSPDVLHGVAQLAAAPSPIPLDLGVTFKSDGRIVPKASDLLYQSVCDGLSARGEWDVHRIGKPGDDFAPLIAAVIHARAGTAVPRHVDTAQRMLVLVQNAPDLSSGTKIKYFLSGMSYGLHRVHEATDRYDVTIAYRDAAGIDHVYHSHQDLLFGTSNKLLSPAVDHDLDGLKPYDTALAAFRGIVDNSVNGTQQRGVISVGKPQLSQNTQGGGGGTAAAQPGKPAM